jgi:DNA-binding beta-propeller fold protein YncE
VTAEEAGAIQNPPLGECCVPAPSVIEFDPEGNVVQAWGGLDSTQQWFKSEHGIYVDAQENVWIGGNAVEDQVVLKLSKQGKILLQIGTWGVSKGSNNTSYLGRPADIAVDIPANEVYLADGYGNRRIIVFNATNGEYKRHWGAYGKVPDDQTLLAYDPSAPIRSTFGNPVHSVVLSSDGFVYVADRTSNRIQVFKKDGTFVNEGFVATSTLSMGSAWDIALSRDSSQTNLYLADGVNKKVWILNRSDLKVIGSLGHGGRQAGQFGWIHNLAMDSKGNLYTTEVETGKRVQKFNPVSNP